MTVDDVKVPRRLVCGRQRRRAEQTSREDDTGKPHHSHEGLLSARMEVHSEIAML
jgi:hypothetical protein